VGLVRRRVCVVNSNEVVIAVGSADDVGEALVASVLLFDASFAIRTS
jgi:hypothetical protein